ATKGTAMKSALRFRYFLCVAIMGILPAGCLFKPTTATTRDFVLTPVSTNQPALTGADNVSVGIGFLKMPSYLLRSSMAVGNGDNEIEYLETARWGQRLDECFQQTLATDLSWLLPSDSVYLTDWAHNQVKVRLFVAVQQFDVDTRGRGALIAQWRIAPPDSD